MAETFGKGNFIFSKESNKKLQKALYVRKFHFLNKLKKFQETSFLKLYL